MRDMDLDSTGKYLLIGGNGTNNVFAAEYATAGDISSSLTGKGSISNPLGGGINSVCWSNDGTKVGIGTQHGNDNVFRSYTVSTAYDLNSTVTPMNAGSLSDSLGSGVKRFSNDSATNGFAAGIAYNDDGTRVYVSQKKAVREYILSTAYDLSTMGSVNYTLDLSNFIGDRDLGPVYTTSGVPDIANGIDWSSDGRTLFVTTAFGGTITSAITGTPGPEIINGGRSFPGPDVNTFPAFTISI